MIDGAPLPPEDMADPEKAYQGYLRYLERTGLSPATKRTYAGEVKQYVSWLKQQLEFPLDEVLTSEVVRDQVVRTYRRHLLGRRMASGVDTAIASVGNFYIWTGLGAAKIKFSSKPQHSPKALAEEQARQVLMAAERMGPRELAITVLGMLAGLRVSEISDLDVDDVWIAAHAGEVLIRRGKGRDGGKQRKVFLTLQARDALMKWLRVRDQWPGADRLHDGRRPLFLSQKGHRLAIRSVRYSINEVGKKAGVEVGPHILRHTMATKMVRNGVDLPSVQQILGHESVVTTSRYARPSQDSLAAAMETHAIRF